ncbi:MAG: PilZ domain-containing protein [Anaerolineaceae bacterium]|nr:PilZ domain-containing protein [Anaerolineaceae bacterium]NTV35940.1 PilZ domain-containing protein [Anaerolineaceae bacterium]
MLTEQIKDRIGRSMNEILIKGQPIKCHNNFRGVPITNPGKVREIQADFVTLEVHPFQIACIWEEKRAYLEDAALPCIVKALPVSFSIENQEVIVSRLEPAGPSFGKRMGLRVHPKDPIRVEINQDENQLTATLADISTNGVGVFTFAALIEEEVTFRKDRPAVINIPLPTYPEVIHLTGVVSNVVKLRGNFVSRIGVRIQPDPKIQTILDGYVQQRKLEIMEELQTYYNQLQQKLI